MNFWNFQENEKSNGAQYWAGFGPRPQLAGTAQRPNWLGQPDRGAARAPPVVTTRWPRSRWRGRRWRGSGSRGARSPGRAPVRSGILVGQVGGGGVGAHRGTAESVRRRRQQPDGGVLRRWGADDG
jgi:hypothetical protein